MSPERPEGRALTGVAGRGTAAPSPGSRLRRSPPSPVARERGFGAGAAAPFLPSAACGRGGTGFGEAGGCGAAIEAAGRRVSAAGASAAATSSTTKSEPTGSFSPGLPLSAITLPETGEGISTVALSVITSASGSSSVTMSPTLTMPGDDLGFGGALADIGHLDDALGQAQRSIARRMPSATRCGPGK